MPLPSRDLAGRRFVRLVVLNRVQEPGPARWHVRCDCGTEKIVGAKELYRNKTKSCGCFTRERISRLNRTHGYFGTPIFSAWMSMKSRCLPGTRDSHRYADRGITVCDRWLESFENFLADMGERPPGMSLDRIDNDGNYEPGNCRWATLLEQATNKANNRRLTFGGQTKCLSEWAREVGISESTIDKRLQNGWTLEDALTKPIRKDSRHSEQAKAAQ